MKSIFGLLTITAGLISVFCLSSCLNITSDKSGSDKSSQSGDGGKNQLAGQKIDNSSEPSKADSGGGQLITGDPDSPPAGRPDTEQVSNGTIHWAQSQILASGIGRAPAKYSGGQAAVMAMRAARIDAARNALNILQNIKSGSPDSDSPVQGILKNFEEVSCTYDQQTRTASCTIRVKF